MVTKIAFPDRLVFRSSRSYLFLRNCVRSEFEKQVDPCVRERGVCLCGGCLLVLGLGVS